MIASSFAGMAQDSTVVKKLSASKNSGLRAYTNIHVSTWFNQPDSIKSKIMKSRGADVYLRYAFRFGQSRYGFAPSLGIGTFNLNSNGAVDTVAKATVLRPITVKYKQNKLSANYVEIPVEFFYESRNKIPWRVGLGFKAGYLLSSNTKFKSSDLKVKTYDIPNMMNYRYGATLQLTYGWFGVNGFYSLTPLFEKNLGPGFTPFSVGITIAPY